MRSNSKGFTLIELLVVIVILGILFAVVVAVIDQMSKDEIPDDPRPVPTTEFIVTTTSTTLPAAGIILPTCSDLDDVGYDGLASCVDSNGIIRTPGGNS